jgi:hypothetical protein
LLHKLKYFSTNIFNLSFKATKVFIPKVISFRWVHIHKRKLNGRSSKAFDVWDKPNLGKISKSYLGYHDFKRLCTSLDYLESLQVFFVMIKYIGLPTFFIIFTSTKRLWDLVIKTLETLHVKRLNLPNKIENLQSIHVTKFIYNDFITCVRYYDHKKSCFCTLFNKDPSILNKFVKKNLP